MLFQMFFSSAGDFSARLQHQPPTETGFVAPGEDDAPHGRTQPKLAHTTEGKYICMLNADIHPNSLSTRMIRG